MNYQFIPLTADHNTQLLEIFDTTANGSEAFRTTRAPDFFSLPNEQGLATHYGIIKNDLLLAVVAVTEQIRIINHLEQKVFYLHDLRMHPVHGNPFAYYRLIQGMLKIYQNRADCKWMFSTVLGSNPNSPVLTKGADLFPKAKQVGEIIHMGWPLFTGSARNHSKVKIIDTEQAWEFYRTCATDIEFAMIDEQIFKLPNGFFLGIEKEGKMIAACKIIDQENARKIISSRPLSFIQKLINIYCGIRKQKKLPDLNQPFKHLYISWHVYRDKKNFLEEFISYLRSHCATGYSYAFKGMLKKEAKKHRNIFLIKFSSKIYDYGKIPAIHFQFPELTLI